ncbi:hypothetical protein [Mycobacterium sp. 852013-50091_SCH5140682]|uniref:hypothetical protein n=1 Tax=Mycobacterium sp. 852013-50091_SCH5140682 TaxID=1834109 RepID=UPI0012EA97E3|nr:hypothetical protein [Mycobacterium sp. 852013-50091_SCH5140682]
MTFEATPGGSSRGIFKTVQVDARNVVMIQRLHDEGYQDNCAYYDPYRGEFIIQLYKIDSDDGQPAVDIDSPYVPVDLVFPRWGHRHIGGIDVRGIVGPEIIPTLGQVFVEPAKADPKSGSGTDGGSGNSPPPLNPPSAPPSPPNNDLVMTLLNEVDMYKRSGIAEQYLKDMNRRENWKVMPEAVLLDDATTAAIERRDIILSKLGLPAGEHEKFLAQVVEAAKETNNQIKTWRKLAWGAVILLVLGLVAAVFFTYWSFQLVADGKINGYELIAIVFVLALVAISPAVLLLLQRPLKGIDQWAPTLSKPHDDGGKDKSKEKD